MIKDFLLQNLSLESVKFFSPEELNATKTWLANFLFEIASQIQVWLPHNVFGHGDVRPISEIAAQFQTLGDTAIGISEIEAEWWRLRHTTLKVQGSTLQASKIEVIYNVTAD